jgi:hypothetical protein
VTSTRAVAALAAASFVAVACSSSTPATAPLGPPAIQIASLEPSGGPSWTPGSKQCVEVGRDPSETIGVKVTLDNWTLRPPGGCAGSPQCGYVRLRVDPTGTTSAFEASAASVLVSAPMTAVVNPLGQHVFRVELFTDSGKQALDEHHAPLADQVSVRVGAAGQCSPSDGGTDAPSDGAVDAPSDAPADAPNDVLPPGDGSADAPADAPSDDGAADAPSDAADAGASDTGAG